MSGWIRVKELPTRFEVQVVGNCGYEVAWSREQALGVLSDWRGQEPSRKIKLVTIRRHQVKRTEVDVQRSMLTTYYDKGISNVVRVIRTRDLWAMVPDDILFKDSPTYPTREEAEAAARKWLKENGYRLRKSATVGGAS